MKLPFVNNGEEFELPKLRVRAEIKILDYLVANTTETDSEKKKQYVEYLEAVSLVLQQVDKNVTRDVVQDNMSFDELFALLLRIRMRGNKIYTCPYCKKKVSIWEMIEEFTGKNKQDFRQTPKDTTGK